MDSCLLCNSEMPEPTGSTSNDQICPSCGSKYAYANGYRTFRLNSEQLLILKQHWLLGKVDYINKAQGI
jgi:transposase-like protein